MKVMTLTIMSLVVSSSCVNNRSSLPQKEESSTLSYVNDSSVFLKKDRDGKVFEKWGNENKKDDNLNFRFFYYYNNDGQLVEEKRYFLEDNNIECIIQDTFSYEKIEYLYKTQKGKAKLVQEKKYLPDYSEDGVFLGLKLYYILDKLTGEFIYHESN